MKGITSAAILAGLLLGGTIASGQTQQGGTAGPITVDELMRMLPARLDFPSPADLRNRQTLKSVGPALLPVIAEAMDRTTNTATISCFVDLAAQIPGDRSQVILRLRRFLGGGKDLKILAVLALREMGSVDDSPSLLPLLHDPSEQVRINVARALGKLGDEEALKEMTQIVGKKKAELKPEELRKDYSIAEMEKAIAVLEKRKANGSRD